MSIYFLLCVGQTVKYGPISIKIGRQVLEETLDKTRKSVHFIQICASTTLENLRRQTEPSMQCLLVHFNESLNSTNTTGSYCLQNR